MKLNRRSFLRSLGAALVAPLLPRLKRVEETDRIADFLMSRDCAGSEEWRIGALCPGTTHYVLGVDPGGENEFAVGDDYFLPDGWMRYPRADWTWEPLEDDVLTDFDHGEEVDWTTRLKKITVNFRERMRNAEWEAPVYPVVMRPEDFDWMVKNPYLGTYARLANAKWCSARLEGVTWTPTGDQEGA